MPITITMPALSPTMTEGTLASWHVKVGDEVSPGDVIAEIETDKATMEVEAVEEGRIGQILVEAGTEAVAVNSPIAILLEEGESEADIVTPAPAPAAAPIAQPEATPVVKPSQPETTLDHPAAAAPTPAPAAPGGGRLFASPLARRIAEQAGLNLASVSGTGPQGRIVKADVEAAIARGVPAAPVAEAAAVPAPVAMPPAGAEYEEIPLNNMRKTIARRLTESKQSVPHFYLTADCRIDKLLELRKELNARADDYKLSVNDFIIRASALALKKVPMANASWGGDKILKYKNVDISVAVAIEGGLITPIVRNAASKGLAEISNEMKDLATRAKDGKLALEEYQGGGFSISNLGMFGIKEFSAVINPPQAAILAVGAGEQRPVVEGGALSVATVMTCTLSCDHRVIDGALGAELLSVFKGFIEDPLIMLL